MDSLIWILAGVVAGWLTGLVVKGRGYGLVGDLIMGFLGGLVGGWLAGELFKDLSLTVAFSLLASTQGSSTTS